MSTIGTTTFIEDGERKYFTLSNEQYLRKLKSVSWRTMRIGILFSVEGTSDFSGGIGVGLVSSNNFPGNIGSKNRISQISRSIGIGTGMYGHRAGYGDTYNLLTYRNTDISGSSFTAPGVFSFAVSNGVRTDWGGDTGAYYHSSTIIPYRKSIIVAHIRRTSDTEMLITGRVINNYTSSNGTNVNHTDVTLSDAMSYEPTVTINGTNTYVIRGTDLTTVDETNYPMDTVNVYTTGSGTFRIYQIMVAVGQYTL